MFSKKTAFVIGAGANCEIGLPSGAELKQIIANLLDIKFQGFNEQFSGSRQIVDALRQHARAQEHGDITSLLAAAWQIRDALPQAISIDNYIDAHRDNSEIELCGKLAIVQSILRSEQGSKLFFRQNRDEKMRFNQLGSTWYNPFVQLLTEGVAKSDIEGLFLNTSFIIFNYDRCVEHFLFHSLMNYYGIDQDTAKNLINQASIIHPYGVVGRLPWQTGTSDEVDFGVDVEGSKLLSAAQQIKTFTQRTDDPTALASIQGKIIESENIVFLGFAFLNQNMQLLTSDKNARAHRVFATAYGISSSDSEIVIEQLIRLTKKHPIDLKYNLRNDLKCSQLFSEYWRSLS